MGEVRVIVHKVAVNKDVILIPIVAPNHGFKCTVALMLFLTCSCLGVKAAACVEYLLLLVPTIFILV